MSYFRVAGLLLVGLTLSLRATPLVIRAGRVFDGESLRTNLVILIDGGRIVDVTGPETKAVPAGATEIDAGRSTVLPGFIDGNLRLMGRALGSEERAERLGAGRFAAEENSGFPAARRNLLQHGITTILDMGGPVERLHDLQAALKSGRALGPELHFPAAYVTTRAGARQFRGEHDFLASGVLTESDTARLARELARRGGTGGEYFLLDERVEPAVARTTTRAADGLGLRVLLSPETGTTDGHRGTPTGNHPSGLGTDGERGWTLMKTEGERFWQELRRQEAEGVTRLEVLRAATSVAARKLGDEKLGLIAPGRRANLVVLEGAADSGELAAERISHVMLNGTWVVENGRVPDRLERRFRASSFSALGYPYWDPLLSWLVGANVTSLNLLNSGVSASVDLLWSVRNMWWVHAGLGLPSPIPRTALRAGLHFDSQNRLFYGIGNDTRLGDGVEYRNLVFKEGIEALTRLKYEWKVKTSLAFDQSRLRVFGSDSLPGVLAHASGNQTLVGLHLVHDRRDHPENPWQGSYFAVGGQASVPGLSTHRFQRFSHDLRMYFSPALRHIVAARIFFQLTFADAPLYYYPDFGGDSLGRGYLYNRYRDKAGFYVQAEYRFPIWQFISGAAFAEVAQFRPALHEVRLNGFHPAFGFGPRFAFGPNETSIIGLDVGFTPEGWNLCLHNGQAF